MFNKWRKKYISIRELRCSVVYYKIKAQDLAQFQSGFHLEIKQFNLQYLTYIQDNLS